MRRALLLTLLAAPAFGFESVCYDSANHYCSPAAGPNTARNRRVGNLDEHRQLFVTTLQKAGLPSSLSAPQTLDVYTSSSTVTIGSAVVPTLQPAPFEEATRVATRTFTAPELAQLPDFSYALWDWASGHEICPEMDVIDPVLCHDFASHMGPVNSNHFAPQTQQFYARYHQRALDRAAECKTMATALAPSGGRFDDDLKACEVEALSLEAVGQHFLQDAWSMGHMWQRWGSPNLSEFPGATIDEKRDRAVLTALVSGFIHGARGVLQALPNWTTYDVNDAMCAPWPEVRFVGDDGTISRGVGDDYLGELTPIQSQRLFDCATSGVLEVYQATGKVSGPASPEAGLETVDPTGPGCFGQRATNEAIVRGMEIDLKVLGLQNSIALDARFASWMLPQVARASGKVPVDNHTKNEFRLSLMRVTTLARVAAKDDPNGTTLANGGLGDFMGVLPNGQYANPGGYEDPSLPWGSVSNANGLTLARAFHRAHASDWCAALGQPQLDALKAHAADVSLDTQGKAAACAICTELASRQLRVGTSASQYDSSKEPLCGYLDPSGTFLYLSGTGTPTELAAQWCCP